MENLDKRVNGFFSNAKKMKTSEQETEFESIKKEYYRSLEDAGKIFDIFYLFYYSV